MLAQELKTLEDLDKKRIWEIQQKLDGSRYNLRLFKNGVVELVGRHSNALMNDSYPEVVEEAQRICKDLAEDITLDGEMVCGVRNGYWFMSNLSLLQSREHTRHRLKIQQLRKIIPATFIAFDILTESLKNAPLRDRLSALQSFLSAYSTDEHPIYNVRRIRSIPTSEGTYETARKLFDEATKLNLEGLMLKDPTSSYEDRRSDAWLKLKTYNEVDVKIIGYTSKNRDLSALIIDNPTKDGNSHVNFTGQSAEIEQLILKRETNLKRECSDRMEYYFCKDFMAKIKYLPSGSQEGYRFPILKEVVL